MCFAIRKSNDGTRNVGVPGEEMGSAWFEGYTRILSSLYFLLSAFERQAYTRLSLEMGLGGFRVVVRN